MIQYLYLSLFSLVLLLGGCSAVEQIGTDAHGIRESATVTLDHLETIKVIGSPEVGVEADAAVVEQENIIELAEDIKMQLPKVRDAVPWWASMINRAVIVAGILGVAFLCWHLGLGFIIKRMFWAIGWFIPRNAMRSAEMDLKLEHEQVTSGEALAARRGSDPAYEAARKRVKKTKGLS
jgi:hypothetical protein